MNQEQDTGSASTLERVTGEVTYKERIMLRPGTLLNVKLLQTSPADAPAKELASQTIDDPKTPPIPFVLQYDRTLIDERYSYSVRATITRGDRLLMTTDTHYPVLTRGAGNEVDLMLITPAKSNRTPNTPLTNTYWKLIEIAGEPYTHSTRNREPHIQFGQQAGSVHGFTGCNNFTGSYTAEDDTLKLSQMASTRKACIEGMDIEQRFLKQLGTVNRLRIEGKTLHLLQNDDTALAFEAVYMQ